MQRHRRQIIFDEVKSTLRTPAIGKQTTADLMIWISLLHQWPSGCFPWCAVMHTNKGNLNASTYFHIILFFSDFFLPIAWVITTQSCIKAKYIFFVGYAFTTYFSFASIGPHLHFPQLFIFILEVFLVYAQWEMHVLSLLLTP